MILNVTNAAARLSAEYDLPQPQVQALYLMLMVSRSLCHSNFHSLENVQIEAITHAIDAFCAQTGVVPERYISLTTQIQEEIEALIKTKLVLSSPKPARARARRTKPHVTKDKP